VLWRKRIARHVEGCTGCDAARRAMVSPKALLGAAPLLVPAPAALRGHTLARATTALHGAAPAGATSWWPPRQPRRPRPRPGHLATAGAGAAAAAAAVALLLPSGATTVPEPVAVVAAGTPSPVTLTQGVVVTEAPRVVPGPAHTVVGPTRVVPGTPDTVTVPGAAPAAATVTVAAPPVTVTAPPLPAVTRTVIRTTTVTVNLPSKTPKG
jgi:hypothetical protein